MIGYIFWESKDVLMDKRVFLFCFNEKCMSGRIIEVRELRPNYFEIMVEFIEPELFEGELIEGNRFTIREASMVLGEGKVKKSLNLGK